MPRSAPYIAALQVLDGDMPQYIHDNTEDALTHFTFLNAYLTAKGGHPMNLDAFRFRSSAAYSTIRVGRLDQADLVNPFCWANKPAVRLLAHSGAALSAGCISRGVTHRRDFTYTEGVLEVRDTITGSGCHRVEQLWQVPTPGVDILIEGADPVETIPAERSLCYGSKQPSWTVRATVEGELPVRLTARISARPRG